MLLVYWASSGDSLTEQLGALRCAVCIARALGAELVLPRWKCGPFWLSSKHVINVAPLAALVPLVSEHDAQARCTARTASHSTALAPPLMSTHTVRCRIAAADTVHCVRLGASCEAAATADFRAYLAALGLATPALLASSATVAAVDAPLRCACTRPTCVCTACALRVPTACALHALHVHCNHAARRSSSSEIRQLLSAALGGGIQLGEVRVLLLPSLAAGLISASATALPPADSHSLCRALATPSVELQIRGAASQPSDTPLERTLVVCLPTQPDPDLVSPDAVETLAAAVVALVLARELQGVALVTAAEVAAKEEAEERVEEGGAAWQVEQLAALLSERVTVPIWRPRLLLGDEVAQPAEEAEAAEVVEGAEEVEEAVARGRLHSQLCARWLCMQAGLLLVTAQQAEGWWLVRARQALGKPVDHSYAYLGRGAHSAATTATAATVSTAAASSSSSSAAAASSSSAAATISVARPSPSAAACAAGGSVLAAACAGCCLTAAGDAEAAGATEATEKAQAEAQAEEAGKAEIEEEEVEVEEAGRSQVMMELMRARLAPNLRAKVLAFLPPTPTPPMTPHPPELPIELYYRWLHRTAPLLCTLAFAPSPPSPPSPPLLPGAPPAGAAAAAAAAGRVAVIIEPRGEAEVVWRTAQVMRNVAAMLGPGWGMQVFHGEANCTLLKAHFSEEEQVQP